MTKRITRILEDRGAKYGGYRQQWTTAQNLKVMGRKIPDLVVREGFDMVCLKLSRVIDGDPMDAGTWEDIVGYAMLVHDYLDRRDLPDLTDTGLEDILERQAREDRN